MHGMYSCVPETNHVSSIYTVAAELQVMSSTAVCPVWLFSAQSEALPASTTSAAALSVPNSTCDVTLAARPQSQNFVSLLPALRVGVAGFL